MRDPFAQHRLPDLPNAGYATRKEKAISDAVMEFLRQMERNRLLLLKIVIDGPHKWRKVAGGKWGKAYLDTDFLNAIYGYLELLAGADPKGQYERLIQMKKAPPWIANNAQMYVNPHDTEKRVRDSLQLIEAVRRGDRRLEDYRARRG